MDYEIYELGEVALQSGVLLPDVILAYKTYGKLNDDKSNAIVYPTALADQHYQNEWLIGPGKALDPERYFIIVPNLLGNGLSTSPSNARPPFDRARFPHVTVFDNVRLQHRLVTEKFGIRKIALVTGWSMGAMQAFQWGAGYPEMVERLAPFAGTAKTWPHTYVFLEGVKAPLLADAAWHGGDYGEPPASGLRAVGRVYAGWGLSPAFYREELYCQLGYRTLEDFLAGFWDRNFAGVDANNLLAMLRTGQHADISANPVYNGDFAKALGSIKARTLVMPVSSDMYFHTEESEFEAKCIPDAAFVPIESNWGHFAGRGISPDDSKFIDDQLKRLLMSEVR
ncbi:alpha/beta fold hydrolase [Paenibacillus hamazuiensis]|uniref:alpha/beta fold hydrolase n=1 Tax=Paenibacillus hamazuiensis TaxID=2936508 RepID=UPI00201000BC|nr:alpha/beta fold hydrolase [Paenibacillus hamazuiensis]